MGSDSIGVNFMFLKRFNKYRNTKNVVRLTVILAFGLTLQFPSVDAAEVTRAANPEQPGKAHHGVTQEGVRGLNGKLIGGRAESMQHNPLFVRET